MDSSNKTENTLTQNKNIKEENKEEIKKDIVIKQEKTESIPEKEGKILYKFTLAKKLGNKPGLMNRFTSSPSYRTIIDFIYILQASVKGMKISEVKKTNNECLLEFDNLYAKLEELYVKNPPKEGKEKFIDPVFKRYHTDLNNDYENIMKSTILKSDNTPENLVIELKSYFMDSFGNPSRIDYGTGHELNYFCFLLILYRAGMYSEEDFPYLVLDIFYKYIIFMRKLQINYVLEPAGARGVWGIDEYQFLPFIFGASQLNGQTEITPVNVIEKEIIDKYKNEYLYIDCIDHIKSVKSGGSFAEYAPILYSITSAKNWEKISKGLVRMYEDDVLKKVVIIQHFYFGSVLTIE